MTGKKYCVYKHTTPSGKVYIGITCQKPEYRWDNGNGYKQNGHFFNAINKYGWENIAHEILIDGLTREQACALEMQLIKAYESTNPKKGYNGTLGGECNCPSEETRAKMSTAKKGKPPHNKGKKMTPEWLQHSREAHAVVSDETRAKQRAAKLGKHLSEAAKEKISKPVVCLETGIVYKSAVHAAKEIGAAQQNISACCRGKVKTAYGYHFAFANTGKEVSTDE